MSKMDVDQNGTTTKSTDEKYCPDCGKVIKVKAEICPSCGIRQNEAPQKEKPKSGNTPSRTLAIVFALFAGGLGAHKFYMGRVGTGFVYLLFCFTFIPAIISLVEAVQYLCLSDEEFEEKYF